MVLADSLKRCPTRIMFWSQMHMCVMKQTQLFCRVASLYHYLYLTNSWSIDDGVVRPHASPLTCVYTFRGCRAC